MASAGLLVTSLLSLGAAGLYLIIGRHSSQGRFSPGGQAGANTFRFWWWGLAAMALLVGLQGILASFWNDAPWIPVAAASSQFLYVLAASTALCGLMCYLWFLYTGTLRATVFFVFFYSLVYVAAGASLAWQKVTGFVAHDYAVDVAYANPLPQEGVVYMGFFGLFIVPQILVAALYLALHRRVGDRAARLRVVLVSASLLALLVPTFVVGALGRFHDPWWLTGQQALQLASSAGILFAHRPPQWVRERYALDAPAVGIAALRRALER